MGRDPPPVLPGRLAAEEAPAEQAAEVWVRWAVLRLALLLMVLGATTWMELGESRAAEEVSR